MVQGQEDNAGEKESASKMNEQHVDEQARRDQDQVLQHEQQAEEEEGKRKNSGDDDEELLPLRVTAPLKTDGPEENKETAQLPYRKLPNHGKDGNYTLPVQASLLDILTETYEGPRDEQGRFHGKGKAIFFDGRVYKGDFNGGEMHGSGLLIWPSGVCYQGQISHNRITGSGCYVWKDGSSYLGRVKKGLRHGSGAFRFRNLDEPPIPSTESSESLDTIHDMPWEREYVGEWREGARNGHGTLYYTSDKECFYWGEWMNNLRDGIGVLQYEDGSTYHGEWYQDCKQGKGEMVWATKGIIYSGEWKRNKPNGEGKMVWLNSSEAPLGNDQPISEQQWMGIQRATTSAFSNEYNGYFKSGKLHGPGLFRYADGSLFLGKWKRGEKVGTGVYVDQKGQAKAGSFDKNVDGTAYSFSKPSTGEVAHFSRSAEMGIHVEDLISDDEQDQEQYILQEVAAVLLRWNTVLRRVYDFYAGLQPPQEPTISGFRAYSSPEGDQKCGYSLTIEKALKHAFQNVDFPSGTIRPHELFPGIEGQPKSVHSMTRSELWAFIEHLALADPRAGKTTIDGLLLHSRLRKMVGVFDALVDMESLANRMENYEEALKRETQRRSSLSSLPRNQRRGSFVVQQAEHEEENTGKQNQDMDDEDELEAGTRDSLRSSSPRDMKDSSIDFYVRWIKEEVERSHHSEQPVLFREFEELLVRLAVVWDKADGTFHEEEDGAEIQDPNLENTVSAVARDSITQMSSEFYDNASYVRNYVQDEHMYSLGSKDLLMTPPSVILESSTADMRKNRSASPNTSLAATLEKFLWKCVRPVAMLIKSRITQQKRGKREHGFTMQLSPQFIVHKLTSLCGREIRSRLLSDDKFLHTLHSYNPDLSYAFDHISVVQKEFPLFERSSADSDVSRAILGSKEYGTTNSRVSRDFNGPKVVNVQRLCKTLNDIGMTDAFCDHIVIESLVSVAVFGEKLVYGLCQLAQGDKCAERVYSILSEIDKMTQSKPEDFTEEITEDESPVKDSEALTPQVSSSEMLSVDYSGDISTEKDKEWEHEKNQSSEKDEGETPVESGHQEVTYVQGNYSYQDLLQEYIGPRTNLCYPEFVEFLILFCLANHCLHTQREDSLKEWAEKRKAKEGAESSLREIQEAMAHQAKCFLTEHVSPGHSVSQSQAKGSKGGKAANTKKKGASSGKKKGSPRPAEKDATIERTELSAEEKCLLRNPLPSKPVSLQLSDVDAPIETKFSNFLEGVLFRRLQMPSYAEAYHVHAKEPTTTAQAVFPRPQSPTARPGSASSRHGSRSSGP